MWLTRIILKFDWSEVSHKFILLFFFPVRENKVNRIPFKGSETVSIIPVLTDGLSDF